MNDAVICDEGPTKVRKREALSRPQSITEELKVFLSRCLLFDHDIISKVT